MNMNWKYISIVFILVSIVGGGILACKHWLALKENVKVLETKQLETNTPKETPPEGKTPNKIVKTIVPSAVWDTKKCWPECITKWHECEDLNCILNLMKQYGASSDARNFTKLFWEQFSERGFLLEFEEMGKVDLGVVAFPDRVNTNSEFYLLNGSPPLVSTTIIDQIEEVMHKVKQDLLYLEMKKKYPDIWFWGVADQFVEKKILLNGNERFIFKYKFVNGCRICNTEYFARIGFDFNSEGKFSKITFLQIAKDKNFLE